MKPRNWRRQISKLTAWSVGLMPMIAAGCTRVHKIEETSRRSKRLAEQCSALRATYARRSLIAVKISATTSPFGFAPRLPLSRRRTLTFPASMSRPPMTSRVWTRAAPPDLPSIFDRRTRFSREHRVPGISLLQYHHCGLRSKRVHSPETHTLLQVFNRYSFKPFGIPRIRKY